MTQRGTTHTPPWLRRLAWPIAVSLALHGGGDAAFVVEGELAGATAVVAVDLDDDGADDRVVLGPAGATWVHR